MFPIHSVVTFIDNTNPNTAMGYGTWTPLLPNADDGCVLLYENPENGPAVGDQGFLVARAGNTATLNKLGRGTPTDPGGTTDGTGGAPVPWVCVRAWVRTA